MNPSLAQIRALLDSIQPDIHRAIADQLAGHPRAQAYDTDKTTGSHGSDPTVTAAKVDGYGWTGDKPGKGTIDKRTGDRAAHDLAQLEAATVRAYTALLCVAALSDHYQPSHEPRRADIDRDTRGCALHLRAGIETHHPAARRTDFGTVLPQPLKDPLDCCQSCYDFVRTNHTLPTNEELVRHARTGKWKGRNTTGVFSVQSIASTRPGDAA